MKAIIQIILVAGVIALGYWIYILFKTPIEFKAERLDREKAVVERLKDIRVAQRSFRSKFGKFAGSFDELIAYVQKDSMEIELAIGSEDDSTTIKTGKFIRLKTYIPIKDTIFNHRKNFDVTAIRYIPFSEIATGTQQEFKLDTVSIRTESKVIVPVFEAFAPYTSFLGDLDKQELINYRDEMVNTLSRADGIKVGSLETANNEAGNWE